MASFSCTYSDQDLRVLLQAVVDAKAADHALTQSEYDHARQTHGYGHTPRAKYIAKRLGASWQSLAAKALQGQAADSQRAKAESKATDNGGARRQPSEIISQATVRHTLGAIHRRLKSDSMSAIQYERERQAMIAQQLTRKKLIAWMKRYLAPSACKGYIRLGLGLARLLASKHLRAVLPMGSDTIPIPAATTLRVPSKPC